LQISTHAIAGTKIVPPKTQRGSINTLQRQLATAIKARSSPARRVRVATVGSTHYANLFRSETFRW